MVQTAPPSVCLSRRMVAVGPATYSTSLPASPFLRGQPSSAHGYVTAHFEVQIPPTCAPNHVLADPLSLSVKQSLSSLWRTSLPDVLYTSHTDVHTGLTNNRRSSRALHIRSGQQLRCPPDYSSDALKLRLSEVFAQNSRLPSRVLKPEQP